MINRIYGSICDRICNTLEKEKAKDLLAFLCYVSFIIDCIEINLPSPIEIILGIIVTFLLITFEVVLLQKLLDNLIDMDFSFGEIWKKAKKIIFEIIMFYIFLKVCEFVINPLLNGIPHNQVLIEESFGLAPILNCIILIILGPIIEEVIFRYLPSRFIKNNILFVIISSVIFAGMHVINYPNALYFIWFYLPNSLYYGYRYSRTKDLFVTISLHSFNNLLATIPLLLACF